METGHEPKMPRLRALALEWGHDWIVVETWRLSALAARACDLNGATTG